MLEIIQKGEIFFGYGMNSSLNPLVLRARKQGLAGLGPRGRCDLLALHGISMDARRRWHVVVGSQQAATTDDRHSQVG
jgi:hypothetical protein